MHVSAEQAIGHAAAVLPVLDRIEVGACDRAQRMAYAISTMRTLALMLRGGFLCAETTI